MGAEFEDGYAVTVAMRGGEWVVAGFDDDFEHLSTAVKAVRNLRSEGAAFALLNVEEEYLVIVRPGPSDVRVLISDATMGVDDDFAAEILDQAGIDIPDIDPDDLDEVDPWEEGDLGLLADLGLPDAVTSAEVTSGVVPPNAETATLKPIERAP